MTVGGMVKSSLLDFPGIIACVLFVPGCNYNCFYCHNRQLLDGSETVIPTQDVDAFLKKRAGQLDGVVITGGEPTLQPGLFSFIRSVRAMGYQIKLDTNGTRPDTVRELLQEGLCDYYAVDYKAPAARYEEICGGGADASIARKTISLLAEAGVAFEVRTTVIPQLGEEDLVQMAKELPMVPRYMLNPYRKPLKYLPHDRDRIEQKPYSREEILRFAEAMHPFQPYVIAK